MIFFSLWEILISVLTASLSGFVFGLFYMASGAIFSSVKEIFFLLPRALINIPHFKLKNWGIPKGNRSSRKLSREIFDFFSFLIFGIAFIVINYLVLDGVFRVYFFIFVLIFFLIAKKTLGSAFSIAYSRAFDFLYKRIFVLISLFILPLYKLIRKITELIKKITSPIRCKIFELRSQSLTRKKLLEIEKILKKAGLTN